MCYIFQFQSGVGAELFDGDELMVFFVEVQFYFSN